LRQVLCTSAAYFDLDRGTKISVQQEVSVIMEDSTCPTDARPARSAYALPPAVKSRTD
jgi:hypothetical protein